MAVLITEEYSDLKRSIGEILDRFESVLEPSRGFFLKPNIVFPVLPDSGEITRPGVVRAVVESLREKFGDVDIVIGEGTAAGTIPEENFSVSGFFDLANDLGVKLIDLDGVERKAVKWQYGVLELPLIALERVHINLPILKLSAAAVISGAIKNTKGLINPTMKKTFHRLGLHKPLADLARLVRPDLTILDCFNFFETRNVFISGTNSCEIDMLSMRLLHIEEPEYLRLVREQEAVNAELQIEGEHLLDFTGKTYTAEKFKRMVNMRLWANPRACSLCRQTLRSLKRVPTESFISSVPAYVKLFIYAIIGADFVFGSRPQLDARGKKVICIGECTRKFAEEKGYTHIPGCPPTREDVIRHL